MTIKNGTFYPTHIILTNKSATDWTSSEAVLMPGEIGIESDTGRIKIGDGKTIWSKLEYTDNAIYSIISAINARLDALEALTVQYEELADAIHEYQNAILAKLVSEEKAE